MARTPQPTVREFDDFRLDLQQQRLLQGDGSPVSLPSRAFELLAYFVEHAGELIEKATLMKVLWPNVIVEENNLSQQLSTLRRALVRHHRPLRHPHPRPRSRYCHSST